MTPVFSFVQLKQSNHVRRKFPEGLQALNGYRQFQAVTGIYPAISDMGLDFLQLVLQGSLTVDEVAVQKLGFVLSHGFLLSRGTFPPYPLFLLSRFFPLPVGFHFPGSLPAGFPFLGLLLPVRFLILGLPAFPPFRTGFRLCGTGSELPHI